MVESQKQSLRRDSKKEAFFMECEIGRKRRRRNKREREREMIKYYLYRTFHRFGQA